MVSLWEAIKDVFTTSRPEDGPLPTEEDYGDLYERIEALEEEIERLKSQIEERDSLQIERNRTEIDGIEETRPESPSETNYVRKFIAAILYCSNKKVTYYGITYEDNYNDREQELLNAIEHETSGRCSEIRYNHGYSESDGYSDDEGPEYPDIEVGVER